MTKRERALILKAICLIHHEDRYEAGMDILADLVGERTPERVAAATTEPQEIREALARATVGEFRFRFRRLRP